MQRFLIRVDIIFTLSIRTPKFLATHVLVFATCNMSETAERKANSLDMIFLCCSQNRICIFFLLWGEGCGGGGGGGGGGAT